MSAVALSAERLWLMSMSVMHRGKRLSLQHFFWLHVPIVVFWGSFRFLKNNDIFVVYRPMCICYFEYFVCVCVCVCVAPARGHVCTARCADPLQGFVVWGTGERWEKGVDKMPSLHSHISGITSWCTHTNLHTTIWEGGNELEQILFNIFCYSSTKKKKKYCCAEHSLEQNTQTRNCLKVSFFQRCQSGMS